MNFTPTSISGVVLITPDRFEDERGFLSRTWNQAELESRGLHARVVERNLAGNRAAGTLRGLHFQRSPHAQAKLITCMAGAIYDVVVDLRPASPSYLHWFGAELRDDPGDMLFIPEGCAHGYETLEPNATVEYLMSEFYAPQSSGGVRWDDPAFGIRWPIPPTVMNDRDRSWPDVSR